LVSWLVGQLVGVPHLFAEAETLFWLHTTQFEDFGLALRTNGRVKADITLFYVNIHLMKYIYIM